MSPTQAFAVCEGTVRRHDPDRYFAGIFAPAEKRPLLFALYAFNHELARVGEAARDPFAAEIRLQWWQDALSAVREGRPPSHPVAVGLAEIVSRDHAQAAELEALVDARAIESSPVPFPTLAAMECHARVTSARLMRMAACILTGMREPAAVIDGAGIAYGLTGMLRSFRFRVRQGKIFIPVDLLAGEGLTPADVSPGRNSGKLKRVFDQIATRAMEHFWRARQNTVPPAALSAVLPASLVPAYLSRLRKTFDPFGNGTDVLRLRGQLIMLRAALLGHL